MGIEVVRKRLHVQLPSLFTCFCRCSLLFETHGKEIYVLLKLPLPICFSPVDVGFWGRWFGEGKNSQRFESRYVVREIWILDCGRLSSW